VFEQPKIVAVFAAVESVERRALGTVIVAVLALALSYTVERCSQ
jgi:hypothetical protein